MHDVNRWVAGAVVMMAGLWLGAAEVGAKRQAAAQPQEIILQGVLSIQAGNNPRVVEMQLLSFLSPSQQAAIPKAA